MQTPSRLQRQNSTAWAIVKLHDDPMSWQQGDAGYGQELGEKEEACTKFCNAVVTLKANQINI